MHPSTGESPNYDRSEGPDHEDIVHLRILIQHNSARSPPLETDLVLLRAFFEWSDDKLD